MPAEDILHCGAVRVRIYGNGTVHYQLIALGNSDIIDPTEAVNLQDTVMDNFTYRTATKLANFKSQKMQLKLSTSDIGDIMICTQITFFVKPLWTGYVG